MDLWAQIYLLDQGATLGKNITTFRNRYCQLKNQKHWTYELLPGIDQVIHKMISPHVIRFDETLFKLPERVINDVRIELNSKARKVYDGIEKKLFAEIDGQTIDSPKGSSRYLLCRQIANGRMYDPDDVQPDGDNGNNRGRKIHKVHSDKIEALGDILDELQGKPALIAYYFRHDLTALASYLERRYSMFGSCPYIGTGVDVKTANKHIEAWNRQALPVLVVHPASLAHGLNLQAGGNDLIFYGLTDTLEDYQQLIKRLHRRGVKGQVRVHRLIAKDTIDEAVINGLSSKATTQTALLDAVKAYRAQRVVSAKVPLRGSVRLPQHT
jgi:SNF2 family DNA or RNA helicase